MAEALSTRVWRHWALFLALALAYIFVRLLPLGAGPGRFPGPDLLVCLSFAWVIRRPDYVPVLLIALAMLTTDILFMLPLGLWTACTVLGAEFLRSRAPFWRDMPFLIEWLVTSVVVIAMTLGNVLILAIFAVNQPALGLTLIQMIATIFAYPVVVFFSVAVLGIRKVAPGAVDQLGHRL